MFRSGFAVCSTAVLSTLYFSVPTPAPAQPQTTGVRRMATPAQTPTSEQMDKLTAGSAGTPVQTPNLMRRTPPVAFPATPTPTPAATPLSEQGLDALFFPRELSAKLPTVMSIVYSGTRRSMIDPCGCHTHQLGGIDKEARLDKELDARQIPSVKVDAGGFLKENILDTEIDRAKVLFKALSMMKYDALNVGYPDLTVGVARLKEMASAAGLKLLSANIQDSEGKLVFEPYEVRNVKLRSGDEIRVGIIGVSRPQFLPGSMPMQTPGGVMPVSQRSNLPGSGLPTPTPPPANMPASKAARGKTNDAATSRSVATVGPCGSTPCLPRETEIVHALGAEPGTTSTAAEVYEPADPVAALKKYLPELKQKSDVIILLDYCGRDLLRQQLSQLGGDAASVNVAVSAEYNPAQSNVESTSGTLVVSGAWEGKNIGHLMLDIAGKKIRANAHRYIDVEQTIPSVPEITKMMDDYKDAMKAKFAAPTPASIPPITRMDAK